MNRLDIRADFGTTLNDDDFDALLCAITGLNGAKGMTPEELLKEVEKRLSKLGREAASRWASVPKGYRLLKEFPKGRVFVVLEPVCRVELLSF